MGKLEDEMKLNEAFNFIRVVLYMHNFRKILKLYIFKLAFFLPEIIKARGLMH